MSNSDLDVVAPYVVEYYHWLSGNPGGTDPEELLSKPLSREQRQILLERMDDINVLWGITAPLRTAYEQEHVQRQTIRSVAQKDGPEHS